MAIRFARPVAAASSSSAPIWRSVPEISPPFAFAGPGASPIRWSSSLSPSSPSPPPSSSAKSPRKKILERLSAAMDVVNDRKLPSELCGTRISIRSETDVVNVAEERILGSMEEGHFENLPGKGKPLNFSTHNPHADPAEDTLYRILSKNRCAPEWVELNREIREDISDWRLALKGVWASRFNGDDSEWVKHSNALKLRIKSINNKVFRYNLIIPFGRQMFGLNWEKELDRLNA